MKTKKVITTRKCLEIEADLYAAAPLRIISRREVERVTGRLFKFKTLKNWDSLGTGPRRKIMSKRGVEGYYIEDIVDLLRERFVVEERTEQ